LIVNYWGPKRHFVIVLAWLFIRFQVRSFIVASYSKAYFRVRLMKVDGPCFRNCSSVQGSQAANSITGASLTFQVCRRVCFNSVPFKQPASSHSARCRALR